MGSAAPVMVTTLLMLLLSIIQLSQPKASVISSEVLDPSQHKDEMADGIGEIGTRVTHPMKKLSRSRRDVAIRPVRLPEDLNTDMIKELIHQLIIKKKLPISEQAYTQDDFWRRRFDSFIL